jgi:hypothetical protein
MNEQVTTSAAGWYPDPDDPSGFRFWDGSSWTEQRHGGGSGEPNVPMVSATDIVKPIVFAISLGFGAAGAASLIAIPVLAFYFPLGLGIAGAAVWIAGITMRGPIPWYAALALLASVGAIIQGGSAYNDYKNQVDQANRSLQNLQQQLP